MPSSDDIARMNAEIERLKTLDVREVRIQWRNRFGQMAPKNLPKSLLVRVLIYHVQADLLGDLEPEVVRVLDRFAARDPSLRRRGRPRAQATGGWPRHKARIRPRPRMGASDPSGHGSGGRLRLGRENLSQPLRGGPRHHRHAMERSALLRTRSGKAED